MSNPIEGKRIVLGVTGSIAAYKAADLSSKLHQQGAEVDVILTEGAEHFITPLTFQSVTARKAYVDADLWGGEGHVTHIGLGHGTQLVVIAPATANTMAKLAHGVADNLLSVASLASACPLIIVPAMDAGMYAHPATQANVKILRERGAVFVGPAAGHLASGLVGVGRMSEVSEILGTIRYVVGHGGPLNGKKIVVTAGGTQEAIDPVRVITNRSSGKQGYALAQAALDRGADVTLITSSPMPEPAGCTRIEVQTAQEMLIAVQDACLHADVLIMAAAVADFRPVHTAQEKIKKENGLPQIILESTTDILKAVAQQKQKTGFPGWIVGFAAETADLVSNARMKLKAKQLDMIVANDIAAPGAGFEVDTNRVTLLAANQEPEELPLLSKQQVADRILEKIAAWMVG